jgi:methylthioribose-1-phosphate isomerase
MSNVQTISWSGDVDGHLVLIDQTRLPGEIVMLDCLDVETVWEAIKALRVRGAPAIGIAAAYGIVVGLRNLPNEPLLVRQRAGEVAAYLATSRPTAVNLFWALGRMGEVLRSIDEAATATEIRLRLLAEAQAIHEEDRAVCHAIGQHGAELLGPRLAGVLTHCNAGGLATAEYGTALSVFFTAQDMGLPVHVFVDETRPLLQGARLTAWELQQRHIPATLICDSMAAQVMKEGRVQAVVTGADRIAANGDSANKIGTYSLAVLARHHHIPFYIAAPQSTFDLSIAGGEQIPIEQRSAAEITSGFGRTTAPAGVQVYNPAFDVTPAELITAIITEHGIIDPVTTANITRHFENAAV